MGGAGSKQQAPADASATWSAGLSDQELIDEAMGWVKMHLCREHFEALFKCREAGGDESSCALKQEAVVRCKDDSSKGAWRQLQMNAMVQCPQHVREYASCMDELTADERESEVARAKCKKLWLAMNSCAAQHVLRHVAEQADRQDGRFMPPPMFTIHKTQRKRVAQ